METKFRADGMNGNGAAGGKAQQNGNGHSGGADFESEQGGASFISSLLLFLCGLAVVGAGLSLTIVLEVSPL